MSGLIAAWITEVILLTYRGTKSGSQENLKGFPLPADYLATFAVYGALGLIDGPTTKNLTAAIGWGFVVATFLNLFDPTLNKSAANPTQAGTQAAQSLTATQSLSATQVVPARTPTASTGV